MSFLSSGRKMECSGCGACKSICPQNCIIMSQDEEGFIYPKVNHNECVNCHRCERVCPHEFDSFISKEHVKAYIGIHNSKEVVEESSSGGVFYAIAEKEINEGSIVYGARFTEDLKVIHDSARTLEECKPFRKSKYIQSKTDECFEEICSNIKNRRVVLFSGLPCQCAAVKAYLKTRGINFQDYLITISILCHGVPSQKIFDGYIAELEEIEHKKVCKYSFKYKGLVKGLYNSRSALIEFCDGSSKVVDLNDDPFLKGYYKRLFYRPSCGECIFAQQDRVADITLSDAWKIEQVYPEYNPLRGVSLIMTATEKGDDVIDGIADFVEIKPIDSDWALNSQAIMRTPTVLHDNRDKFFKIYKKRKFSIAVNHSIVFVPITRIKRIISRRTKNLFHS